MPSDPLRAEPFRGTTERSVPELLTSLISQISTLFRKEVQLARAEMGEKLGEVTGSAAPIAAGGALLFAALILLLLALSVWIASFGLSIGIALLIVGVIAVAAGYALVRSGLAKLNNANLMPSRTAQQLSRDAQVAKEQVL